VWDEDCVGVLEEENVRVWDEDCVGALVVDWEDTYVGVLEKDCVRVRESVVVGVLEYVSFRYIHAILPNVIEDVVPIE
jgi:hypothetical protein